MTDYNETFKPADYLAPKYWLTWLGIGLLYLTSWLPYSLILKLGTALGWLAYYLTPRRRRITRTNIRKAFADIDEDECRRLVKRCFYSSTIALFETAWAWWASDAKLKSIYRIEGLENLWAAEKKGKGVILLGGHYTTLEISGRLLSYHLTNLYPTYKPAHNDLFEAVMSRNRRIIQKGLVASSDMRGILKLLKEKQVVWYAPDQDFGLDRSVFAPFMGIQTATLTITARLAKSSGAPMLPLYSERLPGNQGYLLRLGQIIENFPCGDEVADASTINRTIEKQVKLTPSQYLWVHRRFKTRPEGEPPFYPLKPPSKLKLYRLLFGLLGLPLLAYTLYQAYKYKDKTYLYQRLGYFGNCGEIDPGAIWIHTASVGEINAVLPLLKSLQTQYADLPICLTTTTPTGGQVARARLPENVQLFYLPLDWNWAVQRFMHHSRPMLGLIMETEFWPNLYEAAYNLGIPLIIINGRLTEKTLNVPAWLRYLYCRIVQHCQAIIARSNEDLEKFKSLGARPEKLFQLDNLKFASQSEQVLTPIDLTRSYILAASTRDKEELEVIHAWHQLPQPRPLLVIAPRHPKRLPEILDDIESYGLCIAIRSRNNPVTETTDVYLADTFGELPAFMASADLVFMGGSLVPKGGHNILEPALLGKAIIVGPHMDNFRDETALLLQAQGLIQVANSDELGTTLQQLLQHPAQVQRLADNAKAALSNKTQVIEEYLKLLQQLYPLRDRAVTVPDKVHQMETLIS